MNPMPFASTSSPVPPPGATPRPRREADLPEEFLGAETVLFAAPAPSPFVDAHELLRAEAHQLRGEIAAKRLDIQFRLLARHAHVALDPDRLRRSFRSLLSTAVRSARPGERLTIRSTCPDDCALRVEVEERSPWAVAKQPTKSAVARSTKTRAAQAPART